MSNRKKLMVLGGGPQQLPILLEAEKAGCEIILCDYLPDCPGRKHSSHHYLVSTYDREALLSVAKKEKVDGVITNSEPVQMNVSYITDTLHLPSVPMEVMGRFRNKAKMRKFLTPLGLSDVDFRLCKDVSEALSFFKSKGERKMILKPLDSSASRGVSSVSSYEDIIDAFDNSAKSNYVGCDVLAEEYISGTEFTVDGISIDGKHYTLGISRKKHYPHSENVAKELLFTYNDIRGEYDYDELRRINDEIINAVGLSFGHTHAEYKYSNGHFHLIEVAARGGGAFISSEIVPFLCGINTIRLLIEASLALPASMPTSVLQSASMPVRAPMSIENNMTSILPATKLPFDFDHKIKERAAVLSFFATPEDRSGIIKDIQGLSVFKLPDIKRYELDFSIGDMVGPPENDTKRIGYYIAMSNSVSDLMKCMGEVEKQFKIVLD